VVIAVNKKNDPATIQTVTIIYTDTQVVVLEIVLCAWSAAAVRLNKITYHYYEQSDSRYSSKCTYVFGNIFSTQFKVIFKENKICFHRF